MESVILPTPTIITDNVSMLPDMELMNEDNHLCQISSYLREMNALIIVFVPYCYGVASPGSIFQLIGKINDSRDEFIEKDIRVICITKDPPCSIRNWKEDKDFYFEILSDPTLTLCKAVGTVYPNPAAAYGLVTSRRSQEPVLLPSPGIVIVAGNGETTGAILWSDFPSKPDGFHLTVAELIDRSGVR